MNYQLKNSAAVDQPRPHRGRSRCCLIVEADPEVRSSLEALIRELDVETIGVEDALDALEVLERRPVDLILTEELLPGPSGTMLLRSARYRWPHVARVLVSTTLTPDVLVRAINECGVHRVVSKHMHAVALRDEVGAALNDAWLAAPDCHSGQLTIPPFAGRDLTNSAERAPTVPRARPSLRAVGS